MGNGCENIIVFENMYENPLKSLHRKGHEIELITKKTNYKVLLKEQKTVFGG